MAARFRPLGGDGADRPEPPSVPVFGTAPWGYKRAEVDAWMSWVSGLVEHGRKETLRADSAEATLKATLDQLEQLHSLETSGVWPSDSTDRPDGHDAPAGPHGPAPGGPATSGPTTSGAAGPPSGPADGTPDGHTAGSPDGHASEAPNGAPAPGPLPRRTTRPADPSDPAAHDGPDPVAPQPAARQPATPQPAAPQSATPQPAAPQPAAPQPAVPQPTGAPAEPAAPTGPPPADSRAGREPEPREPTAPDRDPDRPELARLQVVETTLHEVMGLLNRLVESGRGSDRPRDDGR